jgi:bifunctional non-homologous end joining protein LigD
VTFPRSRASGCSGVLRRAARSHPSAEEIRAVPVDFQVADLLWLDGHSITDLLYRERRPLLEGLGFRDTPV